MQRLQVGIIVVIVLMGIAASALSYNQGFQAGRMVEETTIPVDTVIELPSKQGPMVDFTFESGGWSLTRIQYHTSLDEIEETSPAGVFVKMVMTDGKTLEVFCNGTPTGFRCLESLNTPLRTLGLIDHLQLGNLILELETSDYEKEFTP